MKYKEESYVLDTLKEIQDFIRSPTIEQLVKETHENNIILKGIVKAINTYVHIIMFLKMENKQLI